MPEPSRGIPRHILTALKVFPAGFFFSFFLNGSHFSFWRADRFVQLCSEMREEWTSLSDLFDLSRGMNHIYKAPESMSDSESQVLFSVGWRCAVHPRFTLYDDLSECCPGELLNFPLQLQPRCLGSRALNLLL